MFSGESQAQRTKGVRILLRQEAGQTQEGRKGRWKRKGNKKERNQSRCPVRVWWLFPYMQGFWENVRQLIPFLLCNFKKSYYFQSGA